jgi:hypothetical protein
VSNTGVCELVQKLPHLQSLVLLSRLFAYGVRGEENRGEEKRREEKRREEKKREEKREEKRGEGRKERREEQSREEKRREIPHETFSRGAIFLLLLPDSIWILNLSLQL